MESPSTDRPLNDLSRLDLFVRLFESQFPFLRTRSTPSPLFLRPTQRFDRFLPSAISSLLSFPSTCNIRFFFFVQMRTESDVWSWLKNSFISNLRAQQWYNGDQPRYLNGYLNDKSNRLVGWATIKQFRVRSRRCPSTSIELWCEDEYSSSNEETRSFDLQWINVTESTSNDNRSVQRAFHYQPTSRFFTGQSIQGDHGHYSLDHRGYLYECRGSLRDLRTNLSLLHRNGWIDHQTRAVLIQLNLYNPNVQLFSSVIILVEFLSTGSVQQHLFIHPINFYRIASTHSPLSLDLRLFV